MKSKIHSEQKKEVILRENTVNFAPLSVNKAWRGRKFKTNDYLEYEQALFLLLPKKIYLPKEKINLIVTFGMSSKASDVDNPLKPLIDILQKCYRFNDKMIYHIDATKVVVPKGKEFIKFQLTDYND